MGGGAEPVQRVFWLWSGLEAEQVPFAGPRFPWAPARRTVPLVAPRVLADGPAIVGNRDQRTPYAKVGDGGEARLASDARNDSDEVEGGVEDSRLDLSQGTMELVHFCQEGVEWGGGFLHFHGKHGIRVFHARLHRHPEGFLTQPRDRAMICLFLRPAPFHEAIPFFRLQLIKDFVRHLPDLLLLDPSRISV